MKSKPVSVLEDIENNSDLVVGQKLNGYSEILVVSGGEVRMFNRSGSEQTANVPHITNHPAPGLDLVIAGEGCAPSGRLEDAKSIFGSGPAHSVDWQLRNGNAVFTAINIARYKGENLAHIPFGERLDALTEAVVCLRDIGVRCLNIELLYGVGKIDVFRQVIASGGEGVVVKSLRGFEEDWFKVKKVKTWDAVIIGFTAAREGKTGKFKGLIGAIRYGFYDYNGNLRETGKCSGMKDEQRVAFSIAQESFVGRVMEIRGQELGNKGGIMFPRFIRIRDDKLPTECLLPSS